MTSRKHGSEILITANTYEELQAALKALKVDMPERHKGRLGWQAEQWAIVRLLLALPSEAFSYPLTLTKQEKPDFILSLAGRNLGIEHTEAASQKDAHIQAVQGALRDAGAPIPPYHFIEPRHPNDKPVSRKEAESYEYESDGFVGDGVERNWVEAMKHFIQAKLDKYPSYEATTSKAVLVYDNWASISLKKPAASTMLQAWLVATKAFHTVDTVYVMDDTELMEFTARGVVTRKLVKP